MRNEHRVMGVLGRDSCGTICAGCHEPILDRYYLLAVDRQWHIPCLKCCECKLPLDTELTCFSKDGNIYCKDDYYRLFAIKRCSRCQAGISASELVMRARDLVYHVNCFTCTTCGIPLSKGDTFGMRNGLVYCHPHYEQLCSHQPFADDLDHIYRGSSSSPADFYLGNASTSVQKGRPRKRKQCPDDLGADGPSNSLDLLQPTDLSSSIESLTYDSSISTSPGSQQPTQNTRTKRMRTSFKHHQLRTMKSYFAINQNPDAKDLKQLAQKTGLSKRVLQVWFQNARAKWRRNLMRQEGGGSQQPPGPLSASSNSSLDCTSTVLIDSNSQNVDDAHHLHQGYSDIY